MKKGDIVYYLYANLSGKFDFYIVKIEELTTGTGIYEGEFLRAKVIKRIAGTSIRPLTLNHVYTFDKKYLFKQDTINRLNKTKIIKVIYEKRGHRLLFI